MIGPHQPLPHLLDSAPCPLCCSHPGPCCSLDTLQPWGLALAVPSALNALLTELCLAYLLQVFAKSPLSEAHPAHSIKLPFAHHTEPDPVLFLLCTASMASPHNSVIYSSLGPVLVSHRPRFSKLLCSQMHPKHPKWQHLLILWHICLRFHICKVETRIEAIHSMELLARFSE